MTVLASDQDHMTSATASAAGLEPVEPPFPQICGQDDLQTGVRLLDWATAKLRRYVVDSDEVSSHFIELATDIAAAYIHAAGVEARQRVQQPAAATSASAEPGAQHQSDPTGQHMLVEQQADVAAEADEPHAAS